MQKKTKQIYCSSCGDLLNIERIKPNMILLCPRCYEINTMMIKVDDMLQTIIEKNKGKEIMVAPAPCFNCPQVQMQCLSCKKLFYYRDDIDMKIRICPNCYSNKIIKISNISGNRTKKEK